MKNKYRFTDSPLFKCWYCECYVRKIDESGLCENCMPKKRINPNAGGTDVIWSLTNYKY